MRYLSLSVVLGFALAGCNQVLGITDHDLEVGAGGESASGGTSASGGASGRAQGSGGNAGRAGSGAGLTGSGGATGGSAGRTQATAGGTGGQSVGGTAGGGAVEEMGGAGDGGQPDLGPVCGNGEIDGTDECDDGGTDPGDGCSSTCQVEEGWTCDGLGCTEICGDGLVRGSEASAGGCDDNNDVDDDGCTHCVVDPAWSCAGEPSSCAKTCGDGKLQGSEQCDDANTMQNDGCYACALETGFTCDTAATPTTCVDTDECAPGGGNNCDVNASCSNTTGSFTCMCKANYLGDGVTCNPCNCPGGYACTSTMCKTSCSSDNDCVSDRFCSGTSCRVDATQVSISMTHACMALADGTARCWGQNADRELGTTATGDASTPQAVQSLTTAKIVGAGYTQSVALLANGSVVYWGKHATSYDYSTYTTSYTTKTAPTAITGLSTSTDIVVSPNGDGATCTRVNDDTVRCWGFTAAYNGGTNFLDAPTDIGLTGVNGLSGGNSFNCAGLAAGGAKCWGFGSESELGASGGYAAPPGVATGLSGTVSKIRSGDYFTCALLTTGTVQCWGANQNHTLGPAGGSDFSNQNPLTVTGLSSVKDLSAGYANVCAVDTSGGIKCWGDDSYGQLGDGNENPGSGAPVSVSGLAGPASSVATGFDNACAVLQNGSVQCWGRSIGDLSTSVTLTPTTVW